MMESDIQVPTSLERFGPSAPHIGHSNHLCNMASKGRVTVEQMKELIRNPQFICRKCGRVAANSENLCEAVSL